MKEFAHSRNRRSLLGNEFSDQKITGDFRNARAERSTLENCTVDEANFGKSSFVGATLRRVAFHKVNLSQCDFRAATLEGCAFLDCDLDQTDFNSAIIRDTGFLNGRAQYSSFLMATLDNVRFDLDLHGADLRFRDAKKVSYGQSNLWAASINVNCSTFLEKAFSDRQVRIFLALLATSDGNDILREGIKKLAGDHAVKMVAKLTNKVR